MKRALMVLCAITLGSAAPIENIGALRVVGSEIQGENGQAAQLMGMSFYHGQHKGGRDFVKRSVVQSLAEDWRSSVVRIPMMYRSEYGTGGGKGYDQDPSGSIQMVDSIVQAAIDVGIYVVIDWHEVSVIGHQAEAVAFFSQMAQRWGAYPNVIYEIFNEPTSSSWETIKTYATAVIQAIRQHDPDNLIIVGTRNWCQEVMEPARDPLKDGQGNLMSNVAYSLHFYASDAGHQKLRERADSAMAMGIALFSTEWGNSTASGGGALNQGYMDTFMNWMLERKLSWCNWSLSDVPETSAALRNGTWNSQGLIDHLIGSTDGNWPDSDLSQSGLFVKRVILENNPPYTPPQVVSVASRSTFHASSFSAKHTNAGIELTLGSDHNWVRAEIVDVRGAVQVSKKLSSGVSNFILNNGHAPGFAIVRLQDRNGASQVVKTGFLK